MRKLILLLLAALPAWGAYDGYYTYTVSARATTLTAFPVYIDSTKSQFKSVANGGSVKNTVTCGVNSITCPADLVFTSDTAGTTALSFEILSWNASTGQVRAMVSSTLSSSVSTLIYAQFGSAAITTFQGGARGAAYDANTQTYVHLPDGTTLTLKDSTSHANDATNNSGTAATGIVDGAASVAAAGNATTYISVPVAATSTAAGTFAIWMNYTTNDVFSGILLSRGTTVDGLAFSNAGQMVGYWNSTGFTGTATTAPPIGAWAYVAVTITGNTATLYMCAASGTTCASEAGTIVGLSLGISAAARIAQDNCCGNRGTTGLFDEAEIDFSARSSDWILNRFLSMNSSSTYAVASGPVINQDYGVTGATTGYVGVPSANITWTKTVTSWNGSCTLTADDGGKAGIWGSLMSGTGTGTYTPPNTTTTFNATYQAVVAGAITLTFTNSCGEINPAQVTFTASLDSITFTGAPTTGTKGVASSAVTVARASGASLAGLPVPIIDGGNAGLVTPSVGAPCNTPCPITASGSTITYTYNAAVIGIMPLSTTNAQGWTNATPVNDTITKTISKYTSKANSATWNTSAAWNCTTGPCPDGFPTSGDQAYDGGFSVHCALGEACIWGTCPATRTFADAQISNGGAFIVDSGAIWRPQGNVQMNSTGGSTTNLPILQYSSGSTPTPDGCGGSVVYGPFAAADSSFNVFTVGVDAATVSTVTTAMTWHSGALFNVSTYPGSSITVNGTSRTISSCADTTHCTLGTSAGTLTNVLTTRAQSGALTTWPPTTTISCVNCASAKPVLFNDNGHFDFSTTMIYGAAVTGCGSASVNCLAYYLLNNSNNITGLSTSDVQNSTLTSTGADGGVGVSNQTGLTYKRLNNTYLSPLGSSSLIPTPTTGAASTTVCNIENNYAAQLTGNASYLFNNCTIRNNIFAGSISPGGTQTATNGWTLFDSNVIILDCGANAISLGGSTSNNIFDCNTTASSSHFTQNTVSSIDLTHIGNIFEWDFATNEGHCYLVDTTTSNAFTISNNLILPSPVDGGLSCTPVVAEKGTVGGAPGPVPVYAVTNNTAVGNPIFSSLATTGHNPGYYPSNVWLSAMTGNVVYQSAAATTSSFPISTRDVPTTAPANQAPNSVIDYNVLFHQKASTQFVPGFNANCNAGSASLGTPYDTCTTTGTPGVHDTVADPQFVDSTRNVGKWATTYGNANSAAGALALFAPINPATRPSLIANMLAYIRGGFKLTNTAVKTAGPAGATPGCCGFATAGGSALLLNAQ